MLSFALLMRSLKQTTHALLLVPFSANLIRAGATQGCCGDMTKSHIVFQTNALHSLPCPSLQSEQVCCAELEAAKAALQCEALRLAVTAVGCQLRTLFNWLHSMWYQLEGLAKVRAFGTTAMKGQHSVSGNTFRHGRCCHDLQHQGAIAAPRAFTWQAPITTPPSSVLLPLSHTLCVSPHPMLCAPAHTAKSCGAYPLSPLSLTCLLGAVRQAYAYVRMCMVHIICCRAHPLCTHLDRPAGRQRAAAGRWSVGACDALQHPRHHGPPVGPPGAGRHRSRFAGWYLPKDNQTRVSLKVSHLAHPV